MKKIFKYQIDNRLKTFHLEKVEMPIGSIILSAGVDATNTVSVWVECDENQPKETRVFAVIGTGVEYSAEKYKFIGTGVQKPFIWHVFEVLN